jgi:hypothetical protein
MVNRKVNGGGRCIQKCVDNKVFWNWIVLYQRNMRSSLHAIMQMDQWLEWSVAVLPPVPFDG